jgi:Domain of unknown function (DUF4440)
MRGATRSAVQRWGFGALVAAVLVAALAEPNSQPKAQPAPSSEEELVLSTDEALGAAMRAGDKATARRLLSLQFTFVDQDGEVHERKEFLADLKAVAAEAATDPKIRIYGRIAVVTGHHKSVRDTDVFFLDIWAKQKGTWRALLAQDVVLAANNASAATGPEPDDGLAKLLHDHFGCKNPCETIPYRVRSPAEQEIVNTFQAIEKAFYARDADEYAKHMADEFMHYRSGAPPFSKSERIAGIEDAKKQDTPAVMTGIKSMRLWVYGDSAAMISGNGVPDDSDTEPLLRIARVWVKRNGQWQMAISVQTEVKESP